MYNNELGQALRLMTDKAQSRPQVQELERQITKLKACILELERAADTDPLLPIYNRRAFMREINRAKNVMCRYDILSSIVYFDLNDFKTINDRYGHAIGDDILQGVAKVLLSSVRDCDLVARLGGDEFGVLLFKSDAKIAKAKGAALAKSIGLLGIDMPTARVSVTAAWGVSECEPNHDAETILSLADKFMYLDKRNKAA